MTDANDALPDDDLDRGLSAAFGGASGGASGGAEAQDDVGPDEQLTLLGSTMGGVMESIRTVHGVAATVDLGDDGEAAACSTALHDAVHTSRYDVRGEIARGGMGAIYRVRDRDLRRSLAMKVLLDGTSGHRAPGAPSHAEHLNRFLEEAQVTAQLAHPGIVPVHELGVDAQGRVFFTMSLVRGKTLSEIIQLARRGEDGWTRTRALQVILRVCETLAFAHDKGVIHRDIKPDNVMVGRFGETYVMDWGLAKVVGRADLHDSHPSDVDASRLSVIETKRDEGGGGGASPIMTMDGAVVGTPAYMPPEQARGAIADVDERADVYAVGSLLYELLTGNAPYVEPGTRVSPRAVLGAVHMGPPKPIRETESDLPDEIIAICEKAMAREREHRYASAQALGDDIQAFIEGRVVQAYRTGALVEARKWIGRNRALAASVAAGVVVTVAGSIAFAVHARDAAETERAQRVRADGLRLSARAGNEGDTNPALALGLAIQGAQRADSAYGRTTLYRALGNLNERATLEAHGSYVDWVGFDASGGRLVSVSEQGARGVAELILWDVTELRMMRRMQGHTGALVRIALATAGNRLATSSTEDGTLRIWDVSDGTCMRVLEPGAAVADMSWDGAGERLAVVTEAGRLRIWRASGGVAELDVDLGMVGHFAVAVRKDGSQVAIQLPNGSVSVRDGATGSELANLPTHDDVSEAPVRDARIAWLDEGRQIVSFRDDPANPGFNLGDSGWTEIWDVGAAQRVMKFGDDERRSRPPVSDAAGKTVALPLVARDVGSGDVVVWDVAARREQCRVLDAPNPRVVCISPNGRHLVGTDVGGDATRFAPELWDARTGRLEARLRGHTYSVLGCAVTDDGLVATASADTTVRLWRASSPLTFEPTSRWDLDNVTVSALFADLRRAIVITASGSVECRSVPDGRTLCTLPRGARLWPDALDRERNRMAFHVAETNRVLVFDGLDGRLLRDLPGLTDAEPGAHVGVGFSPDGARLLMWNMGRFEIRDAEDGTRLGGFESDEVRDYAAARWCPDGSSILVSVGRYRKVLEFDVATGSIVRRFDGVHTGWLTSAVVSPSGDLVATCAADTSVIVWDRETATVLSRFKGLFMGDLNAAFDPTERFLVVRDPVDTITIVDIERREVFGEVTLPGGGSVAFDDGDLIASGRGIVLRIPLDPVAAARRAQPRPLSPGELGNFDVGDAEERAELEDAYVAWTHAPHRILYVALGAVADGDVDRAARYLARIEEVAPDAPERLVVQAALHVAAGAPAAALDALGRAVDEGCGERPLRDPVFDELRATADWKTVTDRLDR